MAAIVANLNVGSKHITSVDQPFYRIEMCAWCHQYVILYAGPIVLNKVYSETYDSTKLCVGGWCVGGWCGRLRLFWAPTGAI